MNKSPIRYFLVFCILCEFITLAQFILEPSDSGSQVFLGFSVYRWVIILGIVISMVISLGLLFLMNTRGEPSRLIIWLFQEMSITRSVWMFIMGIAGITLLIASFIPILLSISVWSRLRPLLIFLTLVAIGYSLLTSIILKSPPWKHLHNIITSFSQKVTGFINHTAAKYRFRDEVESKWFILTVLVVSFPILFSVAMKYEYPAGYGGLFVLMSQELAQSGFKLPQSVPWYGPGGIPYAYPPAGFYLMAFFTNVLNIPEFVYARYAPPLFVWLSLIPAFFAIKEISRSKINAGISTLLIACSPVIFNVQVTMAGVVRGLAFLFVLSSISSFLLSARQDKKWIWSIISGVFLGLTLLTHLSYAVFGLLFISSNFLLNFRSIKTWKTTTLTGVSGLVVIAPWFFTMVHRYGWGVFLNAFNSHGSNSFLTLFKQPENIGKLIEVAIFPLYDTPIIFGMIVLGLLFAIFTSNRVVVAWFILIVFLSSESERYLLTSGSILVGGLISGLYTLLDHHGENRNRSVSKAIFLFIFIGVIYGSGWRVITSTNTPVINQSAFDLANYVKINTPSEHKYLIVSGPDEAEWFPYLLQRVPVVASWGGEWIGNYNQHLGWVLEVAQCQKIESYICLAGLIEQFPAQPDLLITHPADSIMNRQIQITGSWIELYSNQEYILWLKQ